MNRRPVPSARLRVFAAVGVLLVSAGVLAARLVAADAGTPMTRITPAVVPAPKLVLVAQLDIPCWSCPDAVDAALRFRTDLDLLAPLGTGERNAAAWYAAFTNPGGARGAEADTILKRRTNHATLGKILPADDWFLAEAEPWMGQATMRFYPEVFPLEGFGTKLPNLALALTLARSWVARGNDAATFEDAMADYRRVIQLGRLLRQDDALVINDLVGLAAVRLGAEAVYDRARIDGRLELALAAAVIAGEAPAQKLLTAARMTSVEVMPYLNRAQGRRSIVVPSDRFDGIREVAETTPDRRFQVISSASLALIASLGTGAQQVEARDSLQKLAKSSDLVVASNARWYLDNPIDESALARLLSEDE